MITAATASDVCFVHVLDDTERSLTLAGATPPVRRGGRRGPAAAGPGHLGWVASHREPVVISHDKEADPRYMPFESLRGKDFHVDGVGADGDRSRRAGRRAQRAHRRAPRDSPTAMSNCCWSSAG